ncbi:MAG: hypothetical protein PHE49_11455, partial [bacterium]|nr:hypothetical protein [bacterium]
PELYIWSIIKSGNTIYVGTGGKGKVYKINTSNKSGSELSLLDTTQAGVFSLVENRGIIYAGTSPDGIIYQTDKTGKSKIFAQTKEKYIWKMVFDNNGNFYASTGVTGNILKISGSGKIDTFYVTPEKNVTFLNYVNNYFYAGTGENGYLFKVDKQGKGVCILDANEKEIKEVISLDTLLFVAATEDSAGAVYCIYKDNKVERLWSVSAPIRGLEWIAKDKSMLVAAGKRLYKIKLDGTAIVLNEFPANISCIKDNFVCTSEMGKLYSVSDNFAEEGSIESETYDTDGISEWGKLDFSADKQVKFFTRSGNLNNPDKTYSEWEAVGEEDKINSPNARFIQWKAELRNDNTKLTSVKIAYLPQNRKPKILSLKVTPKIGRDNIRKIVWSTKDENNDSLMFEVYFKLTGEQKWSLLKAELRDTFYSIDPLVFPDGKYEFKMICSDILSNPKTKELKNEKISLPELIDNTAPEIRNIRMEGNNLVFSAVDELNYIKSCEYTIDGGDWTVLFPVDKIFDSKEEAFSVDIGTARKVVIRTKDSFDNTGLKSKVLR